jgi:8-oxo-dGTP diphosphatase
MSDRACVVVLQDDQILMVLQRYQGQDIWTFPGGGIKAGETAEEDAIREAKEEANICVEIVRLLCEIPREVKSGRYYCFLAEIVAGEVRLGNDPELPVSGQELQDIRWFPINNVRSHREVSLIWDQISQL